MIMKKIIILIKKIIMSCFLLYSYNYIAVNFNLAIPINYITVFVVSFLGPIGLCGLIFFKYFIM